MAEAEADPTFLTLLTLTFFAAALSGSTLQWVMARGVFEKGWRDKNNQYNIIVFVAATSSMFLSLFNFVSFHLAPPQMEYSILLLFLWIVMTHSSIMLVSSKLAITYKNSKKCWYKLLLINVAMLPVSLLVCISWGGSKQTDKEIFMTMNTIIEPIQMALWGLIEFVLSGLFIVKMWKFKWTPVERRGIAVLVLVGFCDAATVFSNIIIGDRASTVVKAFVYCLRIRLEVGVLCTMADFLKAKKGNVYKTSRKSGNKSSMFSFGRKTRSTDTTQIPGNTYRNSEFTASFPPEYSGSLPPDYGNSLPPDSGHSHSFAPPENNSVIPSSPTPPIPSPSDYDHNTQQCYNSYFNKSRSDSSFASCRSTEIDSPNAPSNNVALDMFPPPSPERLDVFHDDV